MRRPLRRRVEPRPDETAASLASRLAARNGTTLRGFCLDMQLPLHAVHDGRTPVARALAELAGHDADAFAASTLTRHGTVEDRAWTYRGQHLRTANLSRSCRRVCPLCLSEDVAQGGLMPSELACARSAWRIRHLRTCMVHQVAMVESDDEADRYSTYDTTQVYRGLLRRLPDACRDAAAREPSAFERYLSHRLDAGAGGVGWLDAKPMWATAQLVERVGTAIILGRSPNLHGLSDGDWWEAGRAGLAALEGGPEGMESVLDTLHDTFEFPGTGPSAPGGIYGHLWRWVERDATGPEFDDVREAMREHALSRLPLAAGTVVLGHVVERRRIHSLRSLTVETGRHHVRLRKVLASYGLLPEGHATVNANRLTFDAGQAEALVAQVVAPMGVPEVKAFLGVARVQPLIREGVLVPTPVPGRKAGKHEFTRVDVERLMVDLRRDAVPLDAVGPDQVDLVAASHAAARGLPELVTMVRGRRLSQVWRLRGGQGLRSVILSRDEVKALTRRPEHDALAMHQVIKSLRVHHAAVDRLVRHGVLRSAILPSPRGGNPTRYVTEADLAEFQGRYVTLTEMARTRRTSIGKVRKDLVARGIQPRLRPEEYKTAFYLKSDL